MFISRYYIKQAQNIVLVVIPNTKSTNKMCVVYLDVNETAEYKEISFSLIKNCQTNTKIRKKYIIMIYVH